jgi:hypothetical protein
MSSDVYEFVRLVRAHVKMKMNSEHCWNKAGGGKTETLRGKLVPVTVYPP